MRQIRLAHLSGVPAPSYVPLFRRLAADPRVELTVFFASSAGARAFDGGYGQAVSWDSDLTSGYSHVFLRRADTTPPLGKRFWDVRNWDIVRALIRGRFDVLWMSGYNSLTYMLAASTHWLLGKPVLFREEQTLIDPRSNMNHVLKHLALTPMLRRSWGLYISRENQRWLEHYGVAPERLFSAPYTVDNAHWQGRAAALRGSEAEIRRRLGIREGAGPVIATVSRLIPKKQPLFLLEAFRRVRAERECALLIVGSGPMEAEIRSYVQRHAIPDVIITGFLNRSQLADAYAAADIFTLLSGARETFGLVVPEAMNFSLPIVTSDRVGCAPDLVSHGLNGFVVPAVDVAAAAHAFARLVEDRELRARMGASSLARMHEWEVMRTAEGIVAAAAAATGAAALSAGAPPDAPLIPAAPRSPAPAPR